VWQGLPSASDEECSRPERYDEALDLELPVIAMLSRSGTSQRREVPSPLDIGSTVASSSAREKWLSVMHEENSIAQRRTGLPRRWPSSSQVEVARTTGSEFGTARLERTAIESPNADRSDTITRQVGIKAEMSLWAAADYETWGLRPKVIGRVDPSRSLFTSSTQLRLL
jgi:hypothetical protein